MIAETDHNRRKFGCDLYRVMAMLFVIFVHASVTSRTPVRSLIPTDSIIIAILFSLFHTANNMFFTLSGSLNLDKGDFSSEKDIIRFYKHKAVHLFVPFIFICVIFAVREALLLHDPKRLLLPFTFTADDFNRYSHFWFMAAITALMMLTPFLKILLDHISRKTADIILVMSAIVLVSEGIFHAKNIIFQTGADVWPFTGTLLYYFLGWYVTKYNTGKTKKWFCSAGIVSFVLYAILQYVSEKTKASGMSGVFIFAGYLPYIFVPALLLFVLDINASSIVKKVFSFLSRHIYTIYLLHWTILYEYVQPEFPLNMRGWIFSSIATFCVSLFLAVVLDDFIFLPVIKKLDHPAAN